MDQEQQLRQQLAKTLDGDEAHVSLKAAVSDFPAEMRGRIPSGLPHSAWQLLEHIRIALWDIVEFSRGGSHKSPKWPEGYWPKTVAPPTDEAWDKSVHAVDEEVQAMRNMVMDAHRDLFAPIPHATGGQTLLREVLLAADHTAYHLGQLVIVRKALGIQIST